MDALIPTAIMNLAGEHRTVVELTRRPARHPVCRRAIPLVAALFIAAGCAPRSEAPAEWEVALSDGTAHPMVGRPAPDFVGDSLTPGGWLPLGGVRETPIALLFFRLGGPQATDLVRAFDRFRNDASLAPTRFMGIVNESPDAIRRFQEVHGLTLPILRDPGSIGQRYDLGPTPTVILLDVDHIVRFRLDGYVGRHFKPRIEATEQALRNLPQLRPEPERILQLQYGDFMRMPELSARGPDGRPIYLSERRGRIVILLFLDSACAWCPDRLPAVLAALRDMEGKGVTAFGILPNEPAGPLADFLVAAAEQIPFIVDARGTIALKLPSIAPPELFLLDREGFIRYRSPRDMEDFIAELRRQLRITLDENAPRPRGGPPRLEPIETTVRHVGDAACRGCHPDQYLQWRATPHAAAIARLLHGGRAGDASCTPCHTTGAGLSGGFGDPMATASMTNVQCEVCHGPGADHIVAPQHLKRHTIYGLTAQCAGCDVERFCTGCHDAENDPDFDLAAALPLVRH